MRSENQGTYQMLWDCPNCGTEKLLGVDHRHCPNCGSPQDPGKRYFPKDEERIAVADHVYHGADWACAACETPNANKAEFCVNCGSPRDGAREVKRKGDPVEAAGAAAGGAAGGTAAAPGGALPVSAALAAGKGTAAKAGLGMAGCGCLAVVALIVGGILLATFWKKEAAVSVSGHHWERTVAVETYGEVARTAWDDAIPAGARVGTCSQEVKEKRQVADGETCVDKKVDKGDGTFDAVRDCKTKYREEPVYGQKCTYYVLDWSVSRTAKAEGALAQAPAWPTTGITSPGTCVGCQREGSRAEKYTVTFNDGAGTQSCDFPQAQWSSYAVGQKYKGEASVLTGSLDCGSLKAQ